MAKRYRELVRLNHGHRNAIAILHGTSFPKKGSKTPGVERHLILTMLSLYFLVEQIERLRGKNQWWTACQVRAAIEAQLDPAMPPQECTRRLEKIAKKIAYWQRSATKAAISHDKRRRQDLHDLGIDLRRTIRCSLGI